jgi:hypothetical protein
MNIPNFALRHHSVLSVLCGSGVGLAGQNAGAKNNTSNVTDNIFAFCKLFNLIYKL